MKIPEHNIELGLYYHFKHDSNISINNYAYEVMSIGICTENSGEDKEDVMVIYRPLYENDVYTKGKFCYLRPINNWIENVEINNTKVPRFTKITDEQLLSKLISIRDKMYN